MGAQIGTLILATSGIQLANGFFGTFISLRVVLDDFEMAGVVLSSYFAGFTAGAFFCGRIIARFGHIRVYAAFAGMVVAATATMPLIVGPIAWTILRVVIGFGCAGLFVTTESWLNAKAKSSERGRVFSIYMVGTFIALGLGQLLIGRIDIESAAPLNIIVILFAVALVLVSTTRAEPPAVITEASQPFSRLFFGAPVAVTGAALSGLITGAFYALVPVWMQGEDIERTTIGVVMLAAVLGGLAAQIPIGRLSDRFDRRIVLSALGIGLAATSVALVYLPHIPTTVLPGVAVFGGLMSSLYPVCVAHAHDRMPADRVVAVSGQLILLSGLGSVLGPLIGMNLMQRFGLDGVFYLMTVAALLLAIIAAGKSLTSTSPRHLERPFKILAPQAAAASHDPLDLGDEPAPQAAT
jgi:MFS family permease